jgi:Chromo (CHRromatin Organisation MOdifier) domain
MAGPFEILEQVGHSFRLKLPETMQCDDVFSADKLRKAANDPLSGQINEPPPPVEITDDKEWEVEEVLASKLKRGRLFYRIKWTGYDEDLDWYPAFNLTNAPHKLRDYHLANPNQPGPPRQLLDWLKAWEDDLDVTGEDNRPMLASLRASFFQKGGVM